MRFTTRELAQRLDGQLEGDPDRVLTGFATLDQAGPEDLTYVTDARRTQQLAHTQAGAALVGPDVAANLPLIRVKSVDVAVARLLGLLGEVEDLPAPGIDSRASIAPTARIGEAVRIGPGVSVGANAVIGDGVILCPNVCVGKDVVIGSLSLLFAGTVVEARCRIGQDCRIGPNAVIGSSGFGYYFTDRHNRVPHAGSVEIADRVDIGANSCVDRAKFGATRIGEGTKIDNLCQIAHNVQIGKHCVIVAQVGIAGSAVLKDYVVLGGHVGVRDNITIGQGVRCGAYSAIAQDVPDGMEIMGAPAIEAGQMRRVYLLNAKLPELHQQLRKLEKRIKALESPTDH